MGKDYVCTGYNIDVEDTQKIECNLIVAARNFNAGSAQVAGDAIVAAENISTLGTYVGNNLFATGNNVNISANVTSETSVFARQVTLSGSQPWAHVWADTVTLSGNFKNLDIYANHVIVKSDTVITGKLNVVSAQEPQIETGAHVNSVDYEKTTDTITGNMTFEIAIIFSIIFSLVGTFVCGLLLLLLFRTRPFCLASQRFSKSPVRVLLTGLIACIVIPLIACILLVSCVGIKSMLVLVAFAFCLGLISLPFTALALARKIFKNLNKWGGSILMLLIVGVLACIPYFGILIDIFCTLFTVGSIILCFFDWRKSVKQSENNNPPNPDDFAGTDPTPQPSDSGSPQVFASPQAALPLSNKDAATQTSHATSHIQSNMEQPISSANDKNASHNGEQNNNIGERPASKSGNRKNSTNKRPVSKQSIGESKTQQPETLSKKQPEVMSKIAAALEQEDSAMLDDDIKEQLNIENPANTHSKNPDKSKKKTNLTSPTAADFEKRTSSTNNLEQPSINNENSSSKSAANNASNANTASKNKVQVTEEDLSQAEAILAKLAQEAMLAQNNAQAQNSAHAQGTQSNVQQTQMASQAQIQQASGENSERAQKRVPKLDREAQVQAILDRLQKQQNQNKE